jgi:hypothetical protein
MIKQYHRFFFFFELGLTMVPKLSSNWKSSSLSLPINLDYRCTPPYSASQVVVVVVVCFVFK